MALVKDWRLIFGGIIAGSVLAVVIVLVLGKHYTTGVSFMPQGARTGQLRGLAAQFGFDVAGNEGGESPFFYVDLLRTNEVLTRVVNRRFDDGETKGDYATFQRISEADSALRVYEAIREFSKNLSVTADRRTGLVSYSVTEDSPALSLQIAQVLLEEIARYNRETRQSRAGAERRFVEARLVEARHEVEVSEDSLKTFLQNNRSYRSSPELTFEHDRLERSVTHRAGVVSSLAQNFEQTRLDEVRDTPVFSLVQPPRRPGRHDPRGWVRALTLGAMGGLLASLILRFALQLVNQLRGPRTTQGP
jgi:uncharacterized protein involved in exopolysaccharide biosynthesis